MKIHAYTIYDCSGREVGTTLAIGPSSALSTYAKQEKMGPVALSGYTARRFGAAAPNKA